MVKDWPDLAPPLSVSVADQVPTPDLMSRNGGSSMHPIPPS